MNDWLLILNQQIDNLAPFLLGINILLHLIFAGAVAKDAGNLNEQGNPVLLVSGLTWSFATLVGGIWVAVAYWLLHHSTLTRVRT